MTKINSSFVLEVKEFWVCAKCFEDFEEVADYVRHDCGEEEENRNVENATTVCCDSENRENEDRSSTPKPGNIIGQTDTFTVLATNGLNDDDKCNNNDDSKNIEDENDAKENNDIGILWPNDETTNGKQSPTTDDDVKSRQKIHQDYIEIIETTPTRKPQKISKTPYSRLNNKSLLSKTTFCKDCGHYFASKGHLKVHLKLWNHTKNPSSGATDDSNKNKDSSSRQPGGGRNHEKITNSAACNNNKNKENSSRQRSHGRKTISNPKDIDYGVKISAVGFITPISSSRDRTKMKRYRLF